MSVRICDKKQQSENDYLFNSFDQIKLSEI